MSDNTRPTLRDQLELEAEWLEHANTAGNPEWLTERLKITAQLLRFTMFSLRYNRVPAEAWAEWRPAEPDTPAEVGAVDTPPEREVFVPRGCTLVVPLGMSLSGLRICVEGSMVFQPTHEPTHQQGAAA